MTYETNEHLLAHRQDQMYAAGHVFNSLPTILAIPDYYGSPKVSAHGNVAEFHLCKFIHVLDRWVKGCFKAIRSAAIASGQDEIWVSLGGAFPTTRKYNEPSSAGEFSLSHERISTKLPTR